ncbi:MAG: AIR synthase related protein [Pseudomonadota bacterium]
MNEADRSRLAALFAGTADTARYPLDVLDGQAATLLEVPAGKQLVTAQSALQGGIHLSEGESAERAASVAFCAVAAEVAAVGALPAWGTVSLAVPRDSGDWVQRFGARLVSLAEAVQMQLVAGPVQRGALSVHLQLHGVAERGRVMRPTGAAVGDIIYVSGELGGVAHCTDQLRRNGTPDEHCLRRWRAPVPRIGLGNYLSGVASSCVNVASGLNQAAAALTRLSGLGASIKLDALPLPDAVAELGVAGLDLALYGDGDCELCFTAPPTAAVASSLAQIPPIMGRVTAIGTVDPEPGVRGISARAQVVQLPTRGWRHFTGTTDIVL